MMIENDLLQKINSKNSFEILRGLYGEDEAETARQRYVTLINGIQDARYQNEKIFNPNEKLRVFTAPGRTELAGNHTDHNNGKVLAASIQLDSAAIVQKRNDNIIFYRSTGFPDVIVNLLNKNGEPDLLPKPEETGTTEALVRGIAAELNRRGCKTGGFSANASSTVLPGSGLSSSAAVEVLIGRILDTLYGGNDRSPLEIAQIGQYAENNYFGKPCGLMDQTACAAGGAVAIDFADSCRPVVTQINFDLSAAGYALCVVNTGGSHADLTADYSSIPAEMKAAASFFGRKVLRELDRETVLSCAAEIRKNLGDRVLLRSLHFFDENERVTEMSHILTEIDRADKTIPHGNKAELFNHYLQLVNESGTSSYKLLQNVYSPNNPSAQGISAALALTGGFFRKNKMKGAYRVHGGGFAGTIQAYIPIDAMNAYRACIEKVFGERAVTPLRIRPVGAVELTAVYRERSPVD